MKILLILCLLPFVVSSVFAGYGLEIHNTKNELQIDGYYVNYTYVEGADSQSIPSPSATVAHAFGTGTPYPPVILIRPTGANGICLFQLTYSAPNYTGFRIGGTANAGYDYRVFFVQKNISSEPYGLSVRNAKGEVAYDTGYQPFTIVNVISATMGTQYSHGADDNKVWYILTPLQFQYVTTWPGPPAPPLPIMGQMSGVKRDSTTQCTVDFMSIGQIGSARAIGGANTGTTSNLIVCEFDG